MKRKPTPQIVRSPSGLPLCGPFCKRRDQDGNCREKLHNLLCGLAPELKWVAGRKVKR